MTAREIAVAGCGPAGLAAALLLHRAGHRVTLFDRLDRPAPIGSGLLLQPSGLAVLKAMGLEAAIRRLGQPVTRLFGRALPHGRVVLDVSYAALGAGAHGLAVHRHALFSTLHDAITKAEITLTTRTEIVGSEPAAGGRRILVGAAGRWLGSFDLVVDALGFRSPLGSSRGRDPTLRFGALWATLPWPDAGPFDAGTLEQRYRRASHMIGVLPIGRVSPDGERKLAFFWSLRHSDHAAWRANGLNAWKAEVRALWPDTDILLDAVASPDQMTMARYAHRT